MKRRAFLQSITGVIGAAASRTGWGGSPSANRIKQLTRPLAITMWDFSWLERRWPGAGYEDWDSVLDQLVARGYNAVRIDAFPHLVASAPDRMWELIPVWSVQDWAVQPRIGCVFNLSSISLFENAAIAVFASGCQHGFVRTRATPE